MELKILTEEEKNLYRDQFLFLLEESDGDFLPPLSKRSSPRDLSFSSESKIGNGILSYYSEMSRAKLLVALEGKRLCGFVAFWENYAGEKTEKLYISTLVVAKSARGRGLTAKMYAHLFEEAYPDRPFYTRTWSTNEAHTKILSRFGFKEQKRIKNDRGAGIDTVYFEKEAFRAPALI